MLYSRGMTGPVSADALLLDPQGRQLARLHGLSVTDASSGALTAAVETRTGQPAWLLHDGGLMMGRQTFPARFELPGAVGGGARVPELPHARPWQRAGWRGAVSEWLADQRGEADVPLTPVHAFDTACVLQVGDGSSDQGAYFKAGEDRREVRAAAFLARAQPDLLPELLAADQERGWLLTRDAGTSLLGSERLADWRGAVALLTGFQRRGQSLPGAAFHPFGALPAQVAALLADEEVLIGWGLKAEQLPEIQALRDPFLAAHARLSRLGLPERPAHGDFHPNNVLVDAAGRVRLFDWSEHGVQHPLLDLGWLLAFAAHPARAELPYRLALPQLIGTLWDDVKAAWRLETGVGWQDVSLVSLLHRAAVYAALYRDWLGTVPGFRPGYTGYYLKSARHFVQTAAAR